MIKAEIIADSISVNGYRLTTYVLEYPRFIHAEVMTHRVFSRNAASSRAIPIEKMIQQVTDNPAMPVYWGKNRPGMQATEEMIPFQNEQYRYYGRVHEPIFYSLKHTDDKCASTYKSYMGDLEYCKTLWLAARDSAVAYARAMSEAGLHKQIANRLLEPWFNIRVILSGTEFENFFALRAHKDAQPEFQALANAMLVEYNKSVPRTLKEGDWHIPFGDHIDEDRLKQLPTTSVASVFAKADFLTGLKIMIAVARCARVSYYNFEGKDDYSKDIDICTKLFGSTPRHLSPAEHVAMAAPDGLFHGNFRGWIQFRKFFPNENLRDPRVSTPTA